MPFPPEFLLAAACCRWPPSASRDVAVSRAAAAAIEWGRFLAVAKRHRIEGFANDALRKAGVGLPTHVAAALGAEEAAIARRNLAFAAEGVRLHKTLSQTRLSHLFVKGTTLAILAYGGLGLKSARDIDLLVPSDMLGPAGRVLAGLGYERRIPDPALPETLAERWLEYSKEALWVHRDSGIAVELHNRLVDNRTLLPGVGLSSPRQVVRVAEGVTLPTFARDELFAYLCVHGTHHGWSRLKWLADVAALMGDDPGEAGRLHDASLRLGAGRCSAVALSLCNRLLGTSLPVGLAGDLRADRGVRWLEATALWAMAGGDDGGAEFGDSPREIVRLQASHLLLNRGWRHWLGDIRHKLFYPYTPPYLAMPSWLRPGYTLLRLPGWLLGRAKGPRAER